MYGEDTLRGTKGYPASTSNKHLCRSNFSATSASKPKCMARDNTTRPKNPGFIFPSSMLLIRVRFRTAAHVEVVPRYIAPPSPNAHRPGQLAGAVAWKKGRR